MPYRSRDGHPIFRNQQAMRLTLIVVVALSACTSSDPPAVRANLPGSVQPAGTSPAIVIPRWPADQEAHQLGALDSVRPATVPMCRPEEPLFTGDSVGLLRVGQALREVAAVCPQVKATWHWGDEGIPTPVLLVRFGSAVLQLSLEDTIPASRVLSVSSHSPATRTSAGIHPGSTFAELLRAYDTIELVEEECVLYSSASAASGLSFRLDLARSLDCAELAVLPDNAAAAGLPSHTRVKALISLGGNRFAPSSVTLRNECRLAAQVLETGKPAPHRAEALAVLPVCGSIAIPAMQHLWSLDTLPQHELDALAFASKTNLSDAVLRTLVQTAESQTRPSLIRATALSVLVSIAFPDRDIAPVALTTELPAGRRLIVPYRSHAYGQYGRGDITVSPAEELAALVARLEQDPTPEIRRAARTLVDGALPNHEAEQLRDRCRLAVHVLKTAQPAPHRDDAFAVLPRCGALGVPAMQHLWSIDTLPPHERVALTFASITNLSDAMVRTLVQTGDSPTRPVLIRVSALSALLSIAYPHYSIDPATLMRERPPGVKSFIPYSPHAYSQFGRRHLTVSPGQELAALLARLAQDPSPEVQRAVTSLVDGLALSKLGSGP